MSKIVIFFHCLALFGCVSQSISPIVSKAEAIQIAKAEIQRRQLRIPHDCEITIVDGIRNAEVQGLQEEYFVRFAFTRGGKRDVVYQVEVNKRSRRVDGLLDYRDTVPGGQ